MIDSKEEYSGEVTIIMLNKIIEHIIVFSLYMSIEFNASEYLYFDE